MKLEVTNKHVVIIADDELEEDEVIEFKEETSYFVDGAQFDDRYKLGAWDGRRRLVKKARSRGDAYSVWTAPVGLLAAAVEFFELNDVADRRAETGDAKPITIDASIVPSLRPYQEEAVDAVLEDRGISTGKGLLRLPTRSGKTVIAAAIIARLGLRSLFIVQSNMLLQQTVKLFREVLKHDGEGNIIAQFGGGKNETAWITVASVQAITSHMKRGARYNREARKLLHDTDLAFFDECHHLSGETWRRAMVSCDARYKIGLSATLYLDKNDGATEGAIALTSATGPVLFSLEPSDLIDQGWLCRPAITFVDVPDVDGYDGCSYAEQYKAIIAENETRNSIIADLCVRHVALGESVLVTLSRLNHVEDVREKIEARGLTVAAIVGKTTVKRRHKLASDFKRRAVDVLIGTVFGEGVDLPYLDVVIVGDAMASRVLTMQRLRNLTPYDTTTGSARRIPMKTPVEVTVYDFMDTSTEMMAKHTMARFAEYRKHRAFKLRWEQ